MWNSSEKYDLSEENITLSDGLNKLALLETQGYRQGLSLLHFLSFAPYGCRSGRIKLSPSFLNSVLCCDIVLHEVVSSASDANKGCVPSSLLLGPKASEAGFSLFFGMAGLYCYWNCTGTLERHTGQLCFLIPLPQDLCSRMSSMRRCIGHETALPYKFTCFFFILTQFNFGGQQSIT
jgi:hypothetical protein